MRTEKEYDEYGRVVKETEYNSDGNIGTTYEYEYDETGKCVKNCTILTGVLIDLI